MKWKSFIGLWIVPSFPYVIWLNHKYLATPKDKWDLSAETASWNERLGEVTEIQWLAINKIHGDNQARVSSFDAKAIGVLTAAAILAAIATFACQGPLLAAWLGAFDILFILSGGLAGGRVLVLEELPVLFLDDTTGPTHGAAEMAAFSHILHTAAIRKANLISGSLNDLARAAVITCLALIALRLHW